MLINVLSLQKYNEKEVASKFFRDYFYTDFTPKMTILLYKHLGIRALQLFYTNFTQIGLILPCKYLDISVLSGLLMALRQIMIFQVFLGYAK